jgi:hypothetical protein
VTSRDGVLWRGVEGGVKIFEMFRFKIYHNKTECIKKKIRTDLGRQNVSGEEKKNKGEKNLGKIYKSKKPPRWRRKRISVHTYRVDYDRVQAKKSVHSQYRYSKEACRKVDSENLCWEKPKARIHSQFESLGFVGKYDQSPTNIVNS